ncbi:Alpha/beta-Hydrolases superfamily protein [Thalictrum thalictroides]|uniref:Alpha/beta-Hydrolases superfamily protein n=1 Tax=Thalictrum thalictroides TaxID=46969 RepID=A0A7J6UV04_THATH|nr:Alpha/beta-Hydrolases superfamily protein [Thalictrum thalictroides]
MTFKLELIYSIIFSLLLRCYTGFDSHELLVSGIYTQLVALAIVLLYGWVDKKIKPPLPNICGSPNGPPITSPRIKLSDGRFLAYKQKGVSKEKAMYKVIVVHGFDSSKDFNLPASNELIEELGIYFLLFDRAGYGESDPNPKRSVKSEAFDIQQLADQLEIGSKFYIIGYSMGCYPLWSCLNHIPRSIAGMTLVSPVVNCWWPSLPAKLSKMAYKRLLKQDQWAFRVAHYAPQLLYWWLTQKWFPSISALEGHLGILSSQDIETLKKMQGTPQPVQEKTRQQGVFESLHRDLIVGFGKWDFDLMNMKNPFPHNESSVHIWQGYEDQMVPVELQRYVSQKLSWIQYREVPNAGHLLVHEPVFVDAILRELLLGEMPSFLLNQC